MQDGNEEDVDFVGSPMHAYLKELGFSDADAACEPRPRPQARNVRVGITTGRISSEQREIIECVLRDGGDLLMEEDDALLANLQQELKKSEAEKEYFLQPAIRKLKSVGFSFRHQIGILFCFLSALFTLSINYPSLMAIAAAFLAAIVFMYSGLLLVRRWLFRRECQLVAQLIGTLRTYVQTSRKAVLLIQETNVLARGYLLPTSGGDAQSDATVRQQDAQADTSSLMFCASLSACLTRNTLQLISCVANCSRLLIGASQHLTQLEILQDCLSQSDEDGSELQLDARGQATVGALKHLHTRLVAHCSEYLRLIALAHSRTDLSRLRLHSVRDSSQFLTIHKQLLQRASESLSIVQASYYVNLYAYDADAGGEAEDGRVQRARPAGDARPPFAQYAHAAFVHSRSALLHCARLDVLECAGGVHNVHDTACANVALEQAAAALERARECVALALADARATLADTRGEQRPHVAAQAPTSHDDSVHCNDAALADASNGSAEPFAPGDLFLEADLRREAAPVRSESNHDGMRDAFVVRQRELADRMLREIKPALQVRAADFRERERRFKKEREQSELPNNNELDATQGKPEVVVENERDMDSSSESESEPDGSNATGENLMQLRRRVPASRLDDESQDLASEDDDDDDRAAPILLSGGAASNLLAQLVAQKAQTNRRRREETFELEADAEESGADCS